MKSKYTPLKQINEGQLVQLSSMEMYYEEYGNGAPMLLLHGFGACVKNWYPFVDKLAKHFRLILIDLRGHGKSSNPSTEFTHQQAANDVFELLEFLKIKQFSAMGMSTGGMVLLHMATSQAERIQTMVLISASTNFTKEARFIMGRVSYQTMPEDVRLMYNECAANGEAQILKLVRQFNALSENMNDVNFDQHSLSKIQAHTLIVHGEKDVFFPTDIARNLNHSIPNSELWLIPDGEHVPIFDHLQTFIQRVQAFFKLKN